MPERENLKAVITPRGCLTGSISSRQRLRASIKSKDSLAATITMRGQMAAQITGRGSLQASITSRGQLTGSIAGVKLGEEEYDTYMLVYNDGTEVPAVFVENEVTFTATENDIRKGSVAATASGVTVGTKEIPSYHTIEGYKVVTSGSNFHLYTPNYDYTKLQAIICPFSTSITGSVGAEKVVINDKVYPVQSTIPESNVTVNSNVGYIDLGIVNTSGAICIIRYITYKEIY